MEVNRSSALRSFTHVASATAQLIGNSGDFSYVDTREPRSRSTLQTQHTARVHGTSVKGISALTSGSQVHVAITYARRNSRHREVLPL